MGAARDTLPRTPSQMSESSSSSTVTASKTTVNVTEKTVMSPSIQVNGNATLGMDSSWYDSLSLKQLNDLLCKYIEKVHDLEAEREVCFLYDTVDSYPYLRWGAECSTTPPTAIRP